MRQSWAGAGGWRWALAVLLCMGMAATAHAMDYGDIVVDELAVPRPDSFTHGSVEYRFRVHNKSADKTTQVTIVLPDERNGSSGGVRRTVSLGPMAEARVSLWQPAIELDGSSAGVYINGRLQTDGLPMSFARYDTYYHYYAYGDRSPNVLVASGIDSRLRDHFETLLKNEPPVTADQGAGGVPPAHEYPGRSRIELSDVRANVPVSQWSDAWMGYSAFAGVMLSGQELRSMSASVRQALQWYVEAGGSVLVIGQKQDLPASWRDRLGQETTVASRVEMASLGFGLVAWVSPDEFMLLRSADIDAFKSACWGMIAERMQTKLTVESANQALRVVDGVSIPARTMLVLMFVFALVMGPLNMWYFGRINKRILTLVTIPLFALICSLAVFLFALFAEGISTTGRAISLTRLDQDTGRSITVGMAGYYAPLQPGGGLHFDAQSVVSLQNANDNWSYSRSSGQRHRIDWTYDQHLTSGWIRSRVPAHFTFTTCQVRGEKLQVTQDESGVVNVVNGLGSDLVRLTLTDLSGRIHYLDEPLPAGARATLKPGQRDGSVSNNVVEQDLASHNWRENISRLNVFSGKSLEALSLPAGTYLAELTDPVFIDEGVSKMKAWQTQNFVAGRYAVAKGKE